MFACFGLLAFPIGSIISLFILITLCRPKGCRVLSVDYREIIAATPHIEHRTPVWVWILLGLFILAIVVPMVLPLLATIPR